MTAATGQPPGPFPAAMRSSPALPVGEPVRVAVIGGGTSGEHEVSLASAAAACRALDPRRYHPVQLTIGRDGGWSVEGRPRTLGEALATLQSCAVALPLVHGAPGEDGALAALCDLAGVPQVGPSLRAGALAMDKWATKLVARELGIAVAPAVLVTDPARSMAAWSRLAPPGPVVVKPAGAGSSLGVTLVRALNDLPGAVAAALCHDSRVLVEHLVAGREVDVAVLRQRDGRLRCGPPLEIVHEGLFGYDDKYRKPHRFEVPAALEPADAKQLIEGAVTVAEALEATGVLRVDFFMTSDGPVLNEVNTVPGMTDRSQVPLIFATDGLPYPALLDELLAAALAR